MDHLVTRAEKATDTEDARRRREEPSSSGSSELMLCSCDGVFSVTQTGLRTAEETFLGASEGVLPEMFTREGKTHSE